MVIRRDADSLRSVSPPEQTPYKMWRIVDGRLEPLLQIAGRAEAHSLPRQELPEVYWQNGYVDIVRPHAVLSLGMMAGHRIVPFIVRDPVPELDYADDIPPLEAALIALQRGEWPGVASTPSSRHPI